MMQDNYGDAGDDGYGVVPRTSYFYPPKDNFGRDRHDEGFQTSQNERITSPMKLYRSRYNPVGASDGSLFGVAAVYGKDGVGPRTTHLTYKYVDCCIDGGDFFFK